MKRTDIQFRYIQFLKNQGIDSFTYGDDDIGEFYDADKDNRNKIKSAVDELLERIETEIELR